MFDLGEERYRRGWIGVGNRRGDMEVSSQPVWTSLEVETDRPIILGVVSDTHIPDRAGALHPQLLSTLQQAGVQGILHGGDICMPSVLTQLERVAPVLAVRGNRDWLFRGSLPWARTIQVGGVPLVLLHGHGTWLNYLVDKLFTLLQGYRFQRYQAALAGSLGPARVVVFGHTHHYENEWINGRLWFNPGSACVPMFNRKNPSCGLLHFKSGQVRGEIIELSGAVLSGREWRQVK